MTEKQKSWQRRVSLLWRLKGMSIPISDIFTPEEKSNAEVINSILKHMVNDFGNNSVKLGFNARNKCKICGHKTKSIEDELCPKCQKIAEFADFKYYLRS